MKAFRKLMILLDRRQKLNMVYLLFLMLISALLEATSITMLFPVITAIMEPGGVDSGLTGWLYRTLHAADVTQFVIMVMAGMIVLFILKNLFLLYEQIKLFKFIFDNQFKTSARMMRNYLHRNYEEYLNADTAVIQRNITTDVSNMYYYILALLQVMSEVIMFMAFVVMMVAMNVLMTVVIAATLIITLLIVKKVIKPVVRKAGQDNQDFYAGEFKWISQAVAGIKEMKIAGREQFFQDQFMRYGKGYVSAIKKYNVFSSIPRLLIETVSIASMLGYLIVVAATGGDMSRMTSVIAIFAVAAMRMMPCANRINNYLTSLAYYEPFLMGVSETLQSDVHAENATKSFDFADAPKMDVHDVIELKDITYAYPNTDKLIFDHAHMEIPIGKSVGVVGTTGAGKSTVIDILLGLLQLQDGEVCADGVDIRSNYHGWLKNVGYIPQMIFMLDDTIRNNVAFGIPEEKIDDARVMQALKEAKLDEFVRNLPDGLDTKIGERGVRLSGGQRQRIGIARALMEDPEILIMDEATSALDNDTEKAIMESIHDFQGKKTLVIIAHRLQTIEKCYIVYRVSEGKILVDR